jgi:hypothetical protein
MGGPPKKTNPGSPLRDDFDVGKFMEPVGRLRKQADRLREMAAGQEVPAGGSVGCDPHEDGGRPEKDAVQDEGKSKA